MQLNKLMYFIAHEAFGRLRLETLAKESRSQAEISRPLWELWGFYGARAVQLSKWIAECGPGNLVSVDGLPVFRDGTDSVIDGVEELVPFFSSYADQLSRWALENTGEFAVCIEDMAEATRRHGVALAELVAMERNGTLYNRNSPVLWTCSTCGCVLERQTPPEVCGLCEGDGEGFFSC